MGRTVVVILQHRQTTKRVHRIWIVVGACVIWYPEAQLTGNVPETQSVSAPVEQTPIKRVQQTEIVR